MTRTTITASTAADIAAFQAVEDHANPSPYATPFSPLSYREALASAQVEEVHEDWRGVDGTRYIYAVTVIYAREGYGAMYGVTGTGATVLWAD